MESEDVGMACTHKAGKSQLHRSIKREVKIHKIDSRASNNPERSAVVVHATTAQKASIYYILKNSACHPRVLAKEYG